VLPFDFAERRRREFRVRCTLSLPRRGRSARGSLRRLRYFLSAGRSRRILTQNHGPGVLLRGVVRRCAWRNVSRASPQDQPPRPFLARPCAEVGEHPLSGSWVSGGGSVASPRLASPRVLARARAKSRCPQATRRCPRQENEQRPLAELVDAFPLWLTTPAWKTRRATPFVPLPPQVYDRHRGLRQAPVSVAQSSS
jgi:hypothetical protein